MAVVVLCAACHHVAGAPPAAAPSGADVPFVTIAKGTSSGVREPRSLAIKSEAEWRDLWRAHTAVVTPPPLAPRVDFDQEMVIATFAGDKPTGGHAIEIKRLEAGAAPPELRVAYAETGPPPGAMVSQGITQPYHVVKSRRIDRPVVFVQLTAARA